MKAPNALPTVQSHSSAARFLERMEPLLMAQEARYGLMLGIALAVLREPGYYGKNPPYFAIAEDNNGVAAAASMTPPYGVIVYSERENPRPGLAAIADDLNSQGWRIPTVNGPEPVCTYFAQTWSEMTGAGYEVGVRERTFELRQVIHPTYSPGELRKAKDDDLELLAQWFVEFTDEALRDVEKATLSDARKRMKTRIEEGMVYVWEDGEIVCLVGTSRPTERGIAIGPVYTPPHLRGRGYASSCVAQVSQRQLDAGKSFCTLFTDLANPTSNHIYQVIGYRPVCDYTVYTFKN
jgi:predicted GNAT family acetyltransferase